MQFLGSIFQFADQKKKHNFIKWKKKQKRFGEKLLIKKVSKRYIYSKLLSSQASLEQKLLCPMYCVITQKI